MIAKPPYRIPSMKEIAALPWNGRNVVSAFSGCGGSCLGYRMAGYRVLWANEFIPAAAATYRANHPETILDVHDIRKVSKFHIEAVTGDDAIDILDGSPPCASFSTAGAREKLWGKVKKYSDTTQRTDDLFFEFARLLNDLQPRSFVAENVAGLVRGTAKGYFLQILQRLKDCGYRVRCQIVDASWLGVPQARRRCIFIGIRNDLNKDPVFPKPLPYQYTIADALPWLRNIQVDRRTSTATSGAGTIFNYPLTKPIATVSANGLSSDAHGDWTVEAEADISGYAIGTEWDKMGRPGTQSEKYFQLVRPALDEPCPTITATTGCTSAAGVTHPTERRKFSIAELKRLCSFPDDFVLTGSYSQQWERLGRAVPPVMMYHIAKTLLGVLDGKLN